MSSSSLRDPDRLAALRRTRLLDTDPEEGFDQLADLARRLLGAPVALVSLVDEDRQFFKSGLGLDEPWATQRQTPLSYSFCQYPVASGRPLIVEDARTHDVLRHSAAIADLGVIAYAGMPLTTSDGHTVGAFCAIDHRPRQWTESEIELLALLRDVVIQRIELRQKTEEAHQHEAELEHALESLASSERYHRALAENALDIVTVMGLDGVIQRQSRSIGRVLGYGVEDLIGHSPFEFVHPDDVERVQRDFGRLIADPAQQVATEFRFAHRDGSWRTLEGTGTNLADDPTVGAIVFNSRDVTDRRRTEEQLRQAQKLETLAQLTAGFVHDLNNMLSVVIGNADLTVESLGSDQSIVRAELDDMRAAARSAADLTRKLMAVSRQATLVSRPTDLAPVIESVCRLAQRALPASIGFEVGVDDDVPTVLADAGAVEQMVLNLITNARDAMPVGGTLRIEASTAPTSRAFYQAHPWATSRRYVVLRVRDTGTGMDDATVARIFEPFFTTKAAGQGTGLGMPMVHGIATQLGGGVDVESAPGIGTTISIYLPEAEQAPDERAPSEAAVTQRGGETILLVDDQEPLRRTGRRILERAGYRVLTAEHGAEALAILDRHPEPIGLVVTDLDMPVMDGHALHRAIVDRQLGVRILFSSGQPPDASEPLNHQSQPVPRSIPKPWTVAEFARAVRQSLDDTGSP